MRSQSPGTPGWTINKYKYGGRLTGCWFILAGTRTRFWWGIQEQLDIVSTHIDMMRASRKQQDGSRNGPRSQLSTIIVYYFRVSWICPRPVALQRSFWSLFPERRTCFLLYCWQNRAFVMLWIFPEPRTDLLTLVLLWRSVRLQGNPCLVLLELLKTMSGIPRAGTVRCDLSTFLWTLIRESSNVFTPGGASFEIRTAHPQHPPSP